MDLFLTIPEVGILKAIYAILLYFSSSCQTFTDVVVEPVEIPFFKNTPNECYYLDDFMPVPDGMVPGKSGTLNLRYYSYKYAKYKDWNKRKVVLSFYSQDSRCWSLFEEYYVE